MTIKLDYFIKRVQFKTFNFNYSFENRADFVATQRIGFDQIFFNT